jgi:Na+-transporting oxaloacetate decarboxylase beta subunit/Carboxyl transferase domain
MWCVGLMFIYLAIAKKYEPLLLPSAIPVMGMFMLGNLMKESSAVARLTDSAQGSLMNIINIFLAISVGATLRPNKFPVWKPVFIFRKQIQESEDPETIRERLVEGYRNNLTSLFKAAELDYTDQIIFPENTRPKVISGLMMLKNKRVAISERRHGEYIPL